MTDDNRVERVRQLRLEADAKNEEATAILNQWANDVCPFKVGDVTQVRGYSFSGKACTAESIRGSWDNYRKTAEISVVARVLKKDGTPSAHRVVWTQKP